MKDIFVSCIVPVYNGERYLRKCIDSILNQTYSDYELILIDDGSTDSSSMILDEYKEKDSRVIVIHTENRGVSEARNKGIEIAKGKWLTFIDCDDWVDPDYLKVMLAFADEEIDVVVCSQYYYREKDIAVTIPDERLVWFDTKSDLKCLLGSCILRPYSYPQLFDTKFKHGPIFTGPVSKMYKRELIENKQIHFDSDLQIGEDNLFNLEYIQQCRKGVFVNKPLYHYRITDMSTFHNPDNKLVYWPVYYKKVDPILKKFGIEYFLHLKTTIEINILLQRIVKEKDSAYWYNRLTSFCKNQCCLDAIRNTHFRDMHGRRAKLTLLILKAKLYPLLCCVYK